VSASRITRLLLLESLPHLTHASGFPPSSPDSNTQSVLVVWSRFPLDSRIKAHTEVSKIQTHFWSFPNLSTHPGSPTRRPWTVQAERHVPGRAYLAFAPHRALADLSARKIHFRSCLEALPKPCRSSTSLTYQTPSTCFRPLDLSTNSFPFGKSCLHILSQVSPFTVSNYSQASLLLFPADFVSQHILDFCTPASIAASIYHEAPRGS
jgi:hypothetical protein